MDSEYASVCTIASAVKTVAYQHEFFRRAGTPSGDMQGRCGADVSVSIANGSFPPSSADVALGSQAVNYRVRFIVNDDAT